MAKTKKGKGVVVNQAKQYNPFENIDKYIKDLGRKLDLYETLMDTEINDKGLGFVIVSRKRKSGEIVYCIYLIDKYCLGLKDSFCGIASEENYRKQIDDMAETYEIEIVKVEPNHAFNVIYGAIEYAEDLGFQPYKHFNVSEYLLDDVDQIEFEEIEFGFEGQPLYVEGVNDNAGFILSTLDKSVGEGNYDFVLQSDEFDDDEFDDDEEDYEEDDDSFDEYEDVDDSEE